MTRVLIGSILIVLGEKVAPVYPIRRQFVKSKVIDTFNCLFKMIMYYDNAIENFNYANVIRYYYVHVIINLASKR